MKRTPMPPRRAPLRTRGGLKRKRMAYGRRRRTRTEVRLFRATVLERAGGRCELVLRDRCQRRATQVHHILPRSRGGQDDHANGLAVCDGCHDWIHRNPALATELGYLRHSWDRVA